MIRFSRVGLFAFLFATGVVLVASEEFGLAGFSLLVAVLGVGSEIVDPRGAR